MHTVQFSRGALAFAAIVAVASCASTGNADRVASKTSPAALGAPAPAVASADESAGLSATPADTKAADNSPLVRPGQDPAVAGPGVDIRAMPPGFAPLPAGLEARVEQRWKFLIAGKGEQAYDFLSAGVRSSLNRETYANDMRSRPVKWVSADALDGQCEATSCAARVFMTIKFAMQSTGVKEMRTQSAITERWIRVGDDWFHIPDQYLEGFAK